MGKFTFPIFQLVFLLTPYAVKSFWLFASIYHACSSFQWIRWIAISTNALLISNTTLFNFFTNSSSSDIVATVAWFTSKIIVFFAVLDNASALWLLEWREAFDAVVINFSFASKNSIPQAVVLSQAEIGITFLAYLHAFIGIHLAIFNPLLASAIFQDKIWMISKNLPDAQLIHFPSSDFCIQPRMGTSVQTPSIKVSPRLHFRHP